MEVLQFKISGFMAHFRKVFSNSTSLSYFFPPRTTVVGMLAAALGRDRDSYYEEFSKLEIAVIPRVPLRKLVFGEDYLDTDAVNEEALRGLKDRVPTTKEFVFSERGLTYEIWITNGAEFEKALRSPSYPLSLGPANLLAWIHDIKVEECQDFDDLSELNKGNEVSDRDGVEVVGVVPMEGIEMRPVLGQKVAIEELVPREFDRDRHSGPLKNYYLELGGKAVRVKGKAKGVKCSEIALFL